MDGTRVEGNRVDGAAPEKSVSHTFRVRYAETDAMGIVHHASYVVWLEMGRTEFMRAFGFTYRQLEEMGVVMPVLEINVRYRRPAVYDDELCITTWVDELSRTRIKLAYSIVRTSDGKLLTEGSSLHTFTGRDGRPIRITHHPEAWEMMQRMAPPI
ncbi:MAG: acyl-CoA thioesterase [Chloroflexota bacterium]|nr:acyl-CoA thioesterase [Chloroflexota bacterium]